MTEGRVLIVEDEVIVAEALRQTLKASHYKVIGHATDGREAVQMALQLHPDVILMDIVLRGRTSGIEAAVSIQRQIDTSIIYVTGHSSEPLVNAAARSGALGYIVKPFQAQQVTSSIKIALHRRSDARALKEDSDVQPRSLAPHSASTRERPTATARIHGLSVTPREKDVIRGLISHRRLRRVATVLGISVHTVRNHLKSIFRKLNLHSQEELLELFLNDNHASRSM
jgi:DNA-binding NarL/FixJ family response regulator